MKSADNGNTQRFSVREHDVDIIVVQLMNNEPGMGSGGRSRSCSGRKSFSHGK
jgi:hypothetical protein